MILFTSPTPNGWKVSIMLEELREAGIPLAELDVRTVNIMAGEQFTDQYTAVNPNQKIPALQDGPINLMESCAILQYLGEKYPTPLLPQEQAARWNVLQWCYWQTSNVGPIFGNKLSYTRYMDDISADAKAHPLERFGNESKRLLAVLARQLDNRDFVCGADFTIADIAIYPWVRGWKWSKVPVPEFPIIENWIERVRARPGVARGLKYGVPDEEVDQWSRERKEQYRSGGNSIASNKALKNGI